MTYLLIAFLASVSALVLVELMGTPNSPAINALRSAVVALGSGMVAVASRKGSDK